MKRTLSLLAPLLLCTGCALAPLHGDITPSGYRSPLDNFIMKLPAFAGLQTDDTATEQGGRVEFTDRFGNRWAVMHRRSSTLPSGMPLADVVTQHVVPTYYRPLSPGVTVVRDEPIEVKERKAHFAVVSLPASRVGDAAPHDSVRALLALEVNGFHYVLEQEMNTALTPVKADALTEWQLHDMQEALNHMGEGMRFR